MSLIFVDGVSHLSSNDLINLKWGHGDTSRCSILSSGGRLAGNALRIGWTDNGGGNASRGYVWWNGGTNYTTLIAGMGIRFILDTGSYTSRPVILFNDAAGNLNCYVSNDSSGNWHVYNYAGTQLAVGTTGAPVANTWYWLEWKVTFSTSTAGSTTLRLNGVTICSGSSVRTANVTAGGAGLQLSDQGNQTGNYVKFDFCDIVLMNGLGSVNNDFTGDVQVATIFPNAVGAHSVFARTGGSVSGNYTAVNESAQDGDASYVASSNVGDIDTYGYQSLPAGTVSVLGVAATTTARRDAAGSRSGTIRYRHGSGSESDFANPWVTGLTYATYQQIQETNPVTAAAWNVTDLANQFGPKVSA